MNGGSLDLVKLLVTDALGLPVKRLVVIRRVSDADRLVDAKVKLGLVWIQGNVEDPLLQFWRMKEAGVLANKAYIIFTDVEGKSWIDVAEYEGGQFGSIYLLTYDAALNVGVKPSQRGLFFK